LQVPVDLSPSKIEVPRPRRGLVHRQDLVQRLVDADEAAVVLIEAPAGYGKTTLLTQWAERERPRVAWLSLDAGDDDPTSLLRYLDAAIGRVEPIDYDRDQPVGSPGAALLGARRLASAIATMSAPVTLMLDHVESISSVESRDILSELMLRVPPGSRVGVAARSPVGLPTARLRVSGGLVEIGPADLAMSVDEAPELLLHAGVDVGRTDVAALVERTEGWPAGLYLAALAMQAVPANTHVGFTFSGDDRYMSDYLRSELLDHVSPAEVEFLTRTSVLDAMTGPLCDATLGTSGSQLMLERLEASNLLIVPLDRRRESYRYHHLFGELLRAELARRQPDAIAGLHRNAAAWCEANGRPEAALGHLQAAGDVDGVARLFLEHAQPVWASGRVDTVRRWLDWLEQRRAASQHPAVAVHGTLIYALLGRTADADRWAAAAEAGSHTGTLSDGSTMEALYAYLTALLARDGVDQMRTDAREAWRGLDPRSPYRATMLFTEGLSYLLEDDPDRADTLLAAAGDASESAGATPLTAVVLTERAMIASGRQRWADVDDHTARALAILADGSFDEYWTSALVYAWAARAALRRGDVGEATACLDRAVRLRPLLTYSLPVVSLQALLELARAYISLTDTAGARAVLRQAADITQRRPGLGVLPAQAQQLRDHLDTMAGQALGASALTTAELRLLPLLPTHLSFREIGERLYVSRNTVKSHVMSIYRKLGVSSRAEAIDRMELLGLHGAS
jgi:LuxR family maltose regulon positive regulatory protein